MKYIRPIIVFLLWLGVMGFFLKKEVLPSLVDRPGAIPLLQAGLPELVGDEWMGIYFNREQVGYTHTVLYPYREEGFYGSALDSTVWVELNLFKRANRVQVHSFCLIAPGGEIARLTVSARASSPPATLQAQLAGKKLEVVIQTGGRERRLEFPLPRPSLPLYTLTPFLSLRPLKEGESFSIPALDLLSSLTSEEPEQTTIRFEVTEKSADGYRLLAFYEGITADIRLDQAGNVLEIDTPMGWALKRQTGEEVLAFLEKIDNKNRKDALR